MSENGVEPRVGKAANREYETYFVNNFQFHSAELGSVLIDGDKAAVEWTFEMTPPGGERMTQRQVALQTWKDGRIVNEVFPLTVR